MSHVQCSQILIYLGNFAIHDVFNFIRGMLICTWQPKPTRGKMRIHCLENTDKALKFLKEKKVHLENMGPHDIVDGNHRLILGLIWTIILRFQASNSLFCIQST